MDIGATICRPRAPACLVCPLSADCRAAASGDARGLSRPRPAKKPRPEKVGAAFFAARPTAPSWRGAGRPRVCSAARWSCPAAPGGWATLAGSAPRTRRSPRAWTRLPRPVEHVFTHFTLRLALFRAPRRRRRRREGMVFVAPDEIDGAGFSGLMRKAADRGRSAPGPGSGDREGVAVARHGGDRAEQTGRLRPARPR